MNYYTIIEHYENCLDQFGDSPAGVDWTNESQVDIRYKIMLEIISFREEEFDLNKLTSISLLDYGCGLSHLYEYILKEEIHTIGYSGLEISKKFFKQSKDKYPHIDYILGDLMLNKFELENQYDYIVMNGVFTEKRGLSYQEMFDYFAQMVNKIYSSCNKGIAFNVMSKHVDWEEDFLFHVPLDDMAKFLTKNISRNYVIRNDYKLYEYTVYLYKF